MEEMFCWHCKTPLAQEEVCPTCGMTRGGEEGSAHRLPPGTVLNNRYLVGRVLGEGGFGITYVGFDQVLELKVAIKEYYPVDRAGRNSTESLSVVQFTGTEGASYATGKQRFLYEAKTMARMNKLPQIVNVRDFFEANNTAYIIMEYVDGTNLKDLVNRLGKGIPPQKLLSILKPLFGALDEMHQQGLIHRDISPDNLMLEKGRIRLIDFGCARESAGGSKTVTITLKQGYAPIEQYNKTGQGTWTDVYAMAATIYFCLTGQVPPSSAERAMEETLVPPRKLGVDLTATQEKALMRAMTLMPRHRTRTMAEFHDELYGGPTIRLDPALEEKPEAPRAPAATQEKLTTFVPMTEAEHQEENQELPSRKPEKAPEKPEEQAQRGREGSRREAERRRKQVRKTRNILLASVAGVCVLALALVLLLPEKGTGDLSGPGETSSQTPQTAQGDRYQALMDQAVLISTDDELAAMLAQEDVPAVAIASGSYLTYPGGELCKPLVIRQGGSMGIPGGLTMAGDGYLQVEGELWISGMVDARAGGIHVASTGTMYQDTAGMVLMRAEDDLVLEDGSDVHTDMVSYYDEEAIFANPCRVSSLQQLRNAMNTSSVTSIIIEADITLEGNESNRKPMMIMPGVTVTAPTNGDWEWKYALNTDNTILVNYGRIVGAYNLGDWDGFNYGDTLILNFGEIEGNLFVHPRHTSDENDVQYLKDSGFVNFYNAGTLNLKCTCFCHTRLINTGTIRFESSMDWGFLSLAEATVYNGGTIEANKTEGEGNQSIQLMSRTTLLNDGIIRMGERSVIEQCASLLNRGQLILTDWTASVINHGLIENSGTVTLPDTYYMRNFGQYGSILWNDCWMNEGIVMTVQEDLPAEPDGHSLIPFTWGTGSRNRDTEVWVISEEELRARLDPSDPCETVILDQREIALQQDLEIPAGKTLVVSGSAALHTNGKSITVNGPDPRNKNGGGCLYYNAGALDMQSGRLEVKGTALLDALTNCSSLEVNGGGVMVRYDTNLTGKTNIAQGAVLRNLGSLQLENSAQITIENSGRAENLGALIQGAGSAIRIEGGGALRNSYGTFIQESQASLDLTSRSSLFTQQDIHYVNTAQFHGTVINEGHMTGSVFHVYGVLQNNGTMEVVCYIWNHSMERSGGTYLYHQGAKLVHPDGSVTYPDPSPDSVLNQHW